MLRYMLDTNVCIHLLRRPAPSLRQRFTQEAPFCCISTVTFHELVHGAHRARDPVHERKKVEDLGAGLEVLDFDAEAAGHSGNIHAALASVGQIIGAYDMLIAGHARSLGLTLVTGNLGEFRRVEGLRSEDWE